MSRFAVPVVRAPVHGIARSMILVGGGTALGQGALILVSPVLSRLYDPHAFGLLSVYSAVLAILVTVSSLRFDFAIPMADDAGEAVHLFALSVVLGAAATVGLGLVVLVWGPDAARALGAPDFAPFLWLLPVGLLVLSVGQALAAWAVYHRSFPALGRLRTVQGIGQAAMQVLLGLVGLGPSGLIIGDVTGRLLGMGRLLAALAASARAATPSLAGLRRVAGARWSFARVMSVASVLNALTTQIPFLIIPLSFGLPLSGQYFLAYRMLVLPASLVSAAFNQVFFGEAAGRRDDPQALHDLALQGTVSLLIFSIPTYTILAVGGSSLMTFVFGSPWAEAGAFAQLIAPSLILWTVAHAISSLLLVGRRELESLGFTAMELLARTAALGVGVLLHSLLLGVVLLSIVTVLLGIASLWRFLRVASVRLTELVEPTSRILLQTIPSVAAVLLIGQIAPALVPLAMAAGWLLAIAVAARSSAEFRTMLKATHD